MGRKKKVVVEPEQEGFAWDEVLGSDAKRSIAAVVLFTFAGILLLSFFGNAGTFGRMTSDGFGVLVGWTKWLLIPIFIAAGIFLLRRRKTTLSDWIKYAGLSAVYLSVLGFSHLYQGDDANTLLVVAQSGGGGGYVGYVIATFLRAFFGVAAGSLILFGVLVSGLIAAFNLSLAHFFAGLRDRIPRQKQRDDDSTRADEAQNMIDGKSVSGNDEESPLADAIEPESTINPESADEKLTEHNIGKFHFRGEPEPKPEEDEETSFEQASSDPVGSKPTRSVRRRGHLRWELPSPDLLENTSGKGGGGDTEQTKHVIQSTLRYFGINVEPGDVQVGPTVTQYTFRPAVGVKLSRITTLANDLALALAAHPIRIEAPIPGKSLVGIEVPNKTNATIRLKEIFQTREWRDRKSNLEIVLGQDVSGRFVLADLAKMPHLLIAGATNSGKSVCVNSILLALLYQNSPEDLQLILVDPKRVELSLYNGVPHLKTDVIVENSKVVNALKWAVAEMERRYKLLESAHSRDIFSYREKVLAGEKRTVFDRETNETHEEELEPLPQLVIVIDEMADLMIAHGKEVEAAIVRLAQMARAVGIHLVLATQRPSVEVITGLIKANIPARIAFSVTNQIDSRTILDTGGAEKLLGKGDMLYSAAGENGLLRIQGVFVSENEARRVVEFLNNQKIEKGLDQIGGDLETGGTDIITNGKIGNDEDDELFEAARRVVVETQRASTTYLQTALGIGYPRAARLTVLLEQRGVIGPAEGGKRAVLQKSLDDGAQWGDDPMADQAQRDRW